MIQLKKIISGGQTGVDQAALEAAQKCGLLTGGWCPPGSTCEAGLIPDFYNLKETPLERLEGFPDIPRSMRTAWNVRDSDATMVLFTNSGLDRGSEFTLRCAEMYRKEIFLIDLTDPVLTNEILNWLINNSVEILNIAGPSQSSQPGIHQKSHAFLTELFENL